MLTWPVAPRTTEDWLDELELVIVKMADRFLDGCKIYISGFTEPQQVHLRMVLEYSGAEHMPEIVERECNTLCTQH